MTKRDDNHSLPYKKDTPLSRAMWKAALQTERNLPAAIEKFIKLTTTPNPRKRPRGGPLKRRKYDPPGKK
jgi:hypothetical protein